MKKYFLKFFITIVLLVVPVVFVRAATLDEGYLLTDVNVSPQGSTAMTTISGIVYPLTENDNPSEASIYFKYQKTTGGSVYTSNTITPLANGAFSTMIQLNCANTYNLWLFELPESNLIQVDTLGGSGQLAPAFQIPVICTNNQTPPLPQEGDMLAPISAQTTVLAGVNWGTVNVTDHSINIVNARVLPFVYGGSKTFKIEYGTGTPNQNGQPDNANFLGYSGNITRNIPYNFSLQIGALVPNTNYYLTLWEVDTVTGISTNLLTYFFTQTNSLMTGENTQSLNYTFPNATSVNIYGNVLNSDGGSLAGLPVTIDIRSGLQDDAPLIQSFNTTISNSVVNGNGFYQHTFTGLNSDTIYYISLRQTNTSNVLAGPTEIVMPTAYVPNQGGQNNQQTSANSLVPCDGPDCHFNELIILINRVINFLIFVVAFPFVGIVVAWAGLQLILSGGSMDKRKYAKSIITKVVIGLVVALLCWAIIKLILATLGYTGPLWSVLGTTP